MLRADETELRTGHGTAGGDDEVAIRAIIHQLEHAWNSHDGDAYAAPFADDADFVVIDGVHLRGRDVIAEGHRQIFATFYAGSRNAARLQGIRFLRDDVALAHVRWQLSYRADGAEREMRAMSTYALTKEQGRWSIVAFQNTPVGARGR